MPEIVRIKPCATTRQDDAGADLPVIETQAG